VIDTSWDRGSRELCLMGHIDDIRATYERMATPCEGLWRGGWRSQRGEEAMEAVAHGGGLTCERGAGRCNGSRSQDRALVLRIRKLSTACGRVAASGRIAAKAASKMMMICSHVLWRVGLRCAGPCCNMHVLAVSRTQRVSFVHCSPAPCVCYLWVDAFPGVSRAASHRRRRPVYRGASDTQVRVKCVLVALVIWAACRSASGRVYFL